MYAAGAFLFGVVELAVVCLAAWVFETSPLEVLALKVDSTGPFVIAGYALMATGTLLVPFSRRASTKQRAP